MSIVSLGWEVWVGSGGNLLLSCFAASVSGPTVCVLGPACGWLRVVCNRATAVGAPLLDVASYFNSTQAVDSLSVWVGMSVWDLVKSFGYPSSPHRCRARPCVYWGLPVAGCVWCVTEQRPWVRLFST